MTNKRKMVWNREDGEEIHSCGYYCTRPECVLAQRNEFRDKQYQCTITTATLACKKPVKQSEPDAVLAEREALEKAARQALDALEEMDSDDAELNQDWLGKQAITALRAVLAQQAEPVVKQTQSERGGSNEADS
jgi:hypothetical protein